eukprot:TRINITY_DN11756_c0_g1_i1.p1 TRINITY_DN11756_c0_g1~~TRINITY_DN11756_c0_g1_i1.p1  ORF type:complete len:641 (+),score=192.93 TRINITY_DN11756_c0_g1_i1:86-2008(+)
MPADYPYTVAEYQFPALSATPEADVWFHRGLAWTYGYNHEEAVRCFDAAVAADPKCAMAHWGRAYALGPNYNKPWEAYGDAAPVAVRECHAAAQAAKQLADAGGLQELESGLIRALAHRYPAPDGAVEDAAKWQQSYVAAFEELVWSQEEFRGHADVVALYAEALMGLAPWDLFDWQHGGTCKDGQQETLGKALKVLTDCIDSRREKGQHPHCGCSHFHIHLMEQSTDPEQCLKTCDDLVGYLRRVSASEGHLLHMPSHIYIQTGHYTKAREVNTLARQLDTVYQRDPAPGRGRFCFYTVYCCHDAHFEAWAAMFEGRFADAMAAADLLIDLSEQGIVGADVLTAGRCEGSYGVAPIPLEGTADWFEALMATRFHVLVRFGRWDTVLSDDTGKLEAVRDKAGQQLLLTCIATLRYARTVALAVTAKDAAGIQKAEAEAALFKAAFEVMCNGAGKGRMLMNNAAHRILAVGHEILQGELCYRRGVVAGDDKEVSRGLDHLRAAVRMDDTRLADSEGGSGGFVPPSQPELGLVYDEPWGWMMPARHSLGALALERGIAAKDTALVREARDAYREDLGELPDRVPRQLRHPNNVWALAGLAESNRVLGEPDAEVDARLAAAQKLADCEISSSCFCRTLKHCCG